VNADCLVRHVEPVGDGPVGDLRLDAPLIVWAAHEIGVARYPSWSFPNTLRIDDAVVDASQANTPVLIREGTGVSVADAHLGAVIRSIPAEQITVVTSDPSDARVVAGDQPITIVTI
jgi:hypothetical protein